MDSEVKNYPEYWAGKKLAYPHVAPEAPKFSRSVVVGNLIFVSGCQGMNPETLKTDTDVFEEQMIIALDKVRMAM
ncbi:MAG: RidA family protein, partial [Dehalococcoidia bacterium]|nr:RidA family protein [Dehalococcoidia bacterium]